MRAKPHRESNDAKEQVINEAVKVETTPLNFHIPRALHVDFKTRTASEGKKMREVLEQLVSDYTYKNK